MRTGAEHGEMPGARSVAAAGRRPPDRHRRYPVRFVERGEGFDDDAYPVAPVPKHERSWRHPSEVGQQVWVHTEPPMTVGRGVLVSVVAMGGLLVVGALWVVLSANAGTFARRNAPNAEPLAAGAASTLTQDPWGAAPTFVMETLAVEPEWASAPDEGPEATDAPTPPTEAILVAATEADAAPATEPAATPATAAFPPEGTSPAPEATGSTGSTDTTAPTTIVAVGQADASAIGPTLNTMAVRDPGTEAAFAVPVDDGSLAVALSASSRPGDAVALTTADGTRVNGVVIAVGEPGVALISLGSTVADAMVAGDAPVPGANLRSGDDDGEQIAVLSVDPDALRLKVAACRPGAPLVDEQNRLVGFCTRRAGNAALATSAVLAALLDQMSDRTDSVPATDLPGADPAATTPATTVGTASTSSTGG